MKILLFGFIIISHLIKIAISPQCKYHPADRSKTCLIDFPACEIECEWCMDNYCMECKKGFYLDFKAKKCLACSQNCELCNGSDIKDCYKLKEGFYYDWNEKQIKNCPKEGCISCDNIFKNCYKCESGMGSLIKYGKVRDCKKCQVEGCLSCSYEKLDQCTFCLPGWKLEGNSCIKLDKECKKWDSFQNICLDCPEGQKYSYAERKCVRCPDYCKSCLHDNKCSSCNPGYYLNQNRGNCEPCKVFGCKDCPEDSKLCLNCVQGAYFDLDKMQCIPCHSTCATCSGPSKYDCNTCPKRKRKQDYFYEKVDQVYTAKVKERLISRYPSLVNKEMIISKILHPERDSECVDDCVSLENLSDQQFIHDEADGFDSSSCPTIHQDHPLADKNTINRLEFEYYATSSEDVQKKVDSENRRLENLNREREKIEKEKFESFDDI